MSFSISFVAETFQLKYSPFLTMATKEPSKYSTATPDFESEDEEDEEEENTPYDRFDYFNI